MMMTRSTDSTCLPAVGDDLPSHTRGGALYKSSPLSRSTTLSQQATCSHSPHRFRTMPLSMFPPMTPHLPQELIDHIIDHLYDDHPALHSCSLVSRAWVPTSRLHLFAKISLTVSPGNHRAPTDLSKRLHRLLTASPSIIPNIRELDIGEGSPGHPQVGPYAPIRSTTWVATERTFPALLMMFTHLKRLEFSAQTMLHWATLPRALQNAIRHVFSLPSLTYICLKSWSFSSFGELGALFACTQNLKGLALWTTRVCNDSRSVDVPEAFHGPFASEAGNSDCASDVVPISGKGPVSRPRRCGLEFLTLDYVDFGYLGYWLLSRQSTVDLRSLRELRVAHFHDVAAIERLLATTGSSLEHLHLKPGIWDVYSFDLALNSRLRSLRLTLEEPRDALDWVKTLVTSLLPTNVLEHIGVEFYADLKVMVQGWTDLDALLVRPEFSSLRQVDIGLFAAPSNAEFIRVTGELAGLRARGVLRVYQLGIKSQRSSRRLMPRTSRYENH